MAQRNDIHKPSLLDPADYDFIAAFYIGDSPWMAQSYRHEMKIYEAALEEGDVFMGNFFTKATCDHCGAHFNHGVLFLHVPSDELVHVGHICADETVGLPSRAAKARKQAERFHKEEKAKQERRDAGAAWREENRELVAWLEAQANEGDFIGAMKGALDNWGTLTYGQARGVERWREGQAKREERAKADARRSENTGPLVEGRRVVTGKVISTKWKDTPFGNVKKMLVEEPDGNRVYGTCPAAINDDEELTGVKVVFTATVTKSDRDEHFGWFSKPTQASRVD